MKNILFKLSIFMVAALTLGSCTDDFDQVNTNPLALDFNRLADDPLLQAQLFSKAQLQTFNSNFQTGQNLSGDLWCQYFATTQSRFESDRYSLNLNWMNSQWNAHISNEFKQTKSILDFTEASGNEVGNAMAKVWWVYSTQRMADFFGPIPYSQYGNLELSVPYDSVEDIYADYFVKLDEAVAQFKANPDGASFSSNDRIYDGTSVKWLKFANSLRLRVAMRIRYADPAKAKIEAEKAVADGVFMENTDGAYVLTDDNTRNEFTRLTDWGEFRMSALQESILKGYNDPRLPVMFAPAEEGDRADDADDSPYEGLLNGQAVTFLETNQNLVHSDMATKWKNLNSGGTNPDYIAMNTAEVYFLRAEGATLGWNMNGTAKELYEEGIRKSISEVTVATPAEIEAYIAGTNPPAPYETGAATTTDIPVAFIDGDPEKQLEQIITQKWIGNYPNGYESWAELRRTGYPKQYTRVNSDNPDVGPDEILRRMVYPPTTFDTNEAETINAVNNLLGGPDKASTKLWWDKK